MASTPPQSKKNDMALPYTLMTIFTFLLVVMVALPFYTAVAHDRDWAEKKIAQRYKVEVKAPKYYGERGEWLIDGLKRDCQLRNPSVFEATLECYDGPVIPHANTVE